MFLRRSSDRVVRASSQKNRGQHKARLRLGTLEDRVVPSTTPFADASSHAAHPLVQFASPANGPDPQGSPTPVGLTPAKVRHAYGIDAITFSAGTIVGDGTGQTIAIIDAFDDPNITADLHALRDLPKA